MSKRRKKKQLPSTARRVEDDQIISVIRSEWGEGFTKRNVREVWNQMDAKVQQAFRFQLRKGKLREFVKLWTKQLPPSEPGEDPK